MRQGSLKLMQEAVRYKIKQQQCFHFKLLSSRTNCSRDLELTRFVCNRNSITNMNSSVKPLPLLRERRTFNYITYRDICASLLARRASAGANLVRMFAPGTAPSCTLNVRFLDCFFSGSAEPLNLHEYTHGATIIISNQHK